MANNIEIRRNYIVNLLKDIENDEIDNLLLLRKYVDDNKIVLKDLNNEDFDIVIFAIESNVSTKMIKYIIEQCHYETFNYTFDITENFRNYFDNYFYMNIKYKVPLFSAIRKENFEVADLLIEKNANINYLAKGKQNVVNYLYDCYHSIYKTEFKYIIKNGFYVTGFTSKLISEIILDGYNDLLLKSIFDYRIYDDAFILNLLSIYKNKIALSDSQINNILRIEKSKIKIEDSMYENAIRRNHFDSIVLLLKYDSDEPDIILNKIDKYNLLDIAVYSVEYNLMVEVLNYILLSFKSSELESIFLKESRNNDIKFVLRILFENLFRQKSWTVPSSKCETILLAASKVNNKNIMLLLLKLLFNESMCSNEQFKLLTSESPNVKKHLEMLMTGSSTADNKFRIISKESTAITDQLKSILDDLLGSNLTDNLNVNLIKDCDTPFLSLILNIAIKTKSFDVIKYMVENPSLKSKLNINIKDRNGEFPIIVSQEIVTINSSNIDIFKYLLDHHASINVKNDEGISLFELALQNNKYMITKLLLKKDLSIIETINNKSDPLIEAICHHDVYMIKQLINKKNLNDNSNSLNNNLVNKPSNNHYEFTPLILSYLLNYEDIFKALINNNNNDNNDNNDNGDNNNNMEELDNFGYSLFHFALLKEDLKTIQYLLDQKVNIDFKRNENGYGHSVFDIIINMGNKDLFLMILNSSNININEINSQEEVPLITLMKSQLYSVEDKITMLECLFERSPDVNVLDNDGKSAMAYAIQESSLAMVKLFIKNGADVDFVDGNKNSPIIYAIKEKSLPIVKLLIEHGVDVNFIDLFDVSLLAYAIQEKSLPLVEYLVEHGADINFIIKNLDEDRNESMLLYSMELGEFSIVKYLLDCKANEDYDFTDERNIYRIIRILYKYENTDIFEYLIDNKININDITSKIIKGILWRNRLDFLDILIDHNLIISEREEDNYSSLVTAVYTRNIDIVKYVLKSGVGIEYLNRRISSVEKVIFFNEEEILKLLVEHHLDINAKDKKGDTPLIYAIKNRNISIVKYLLKLGADANYNGSRDGSLEEINRHYNSEFHLDEYKQIKHLLNQYKH